MSETGRQVGADPSAPHEVPTAEATGPGALELRIDRRPILLILLERAWPYVMLALLGAGSWAIAAFTNLDGLSPQGHRAIGVFVFCVSLWIWGRYPLVVPALAAMVLVPASGALPTSEAYPLFGSEAVFFILGVFVLGAGLQKTGLSLRVGLLVLQRFGRTPGSLLVSMFLLNVLLAFVMSEHAVAAMMFPIVHEISRSLEARPRQSDYVRSLYLAMAWGTTIGGVATLLGGGRAPLALGMLREAGGGSISFFQWASVGAPLSAAMACVCLVILLRGFKRDVPSVDAAVARIEDRVRSLGKIKGDEITVGLITVAAIAGWVFGGEQVGLAAIALGAVVALFITGAVKWKDVERFVNWGVFLMYGGAILLGATLARTGAASWVAGRVLSSWAPPAVVTIAVVSALAIVLTEFLSNSAVVAIIVPVVLGLAPTLGIDPRILIFAVALPAGLAFTLPMGTPANAIAFSSGTLRMRDMARPGIILSVTAWVVFNVLAYLYMPLLGYGATTGVTPP